jgi:hypothetical protein
MFSPLTQVRYFNILILHNIDASLCVGGFLDLTVVRGEPLFSASMMQRNAALERYRVLIFMQFERGDLVSLLPP